MLILSKRHCRRILSHYIQHYSRTRTRLALDEDAPEPRIKHGPGRGEIVAAPEDGELRHRFERRAGSPGMALGGGTGLLSWSSLALRG